MYGVNCAFCHGSDARGGEGGPNLLRAELVLNDRNGEWIAPVVQNGRADRGMPAMAVSMPRIVDIAAFVHSFRVGGYDVSRMRPPSILVGDPKAGEAYFKTARAGRGGFGGPAAASNVPPATVTVTPASGPQVEGRLVRIDDFIVTLTLADGMQRTFRRDGETPKVEIHDPLQPHKDLQRRYSDTDIHNLTAYLVTVK